MSRQFWLSIAITAIAVNTAMAATKPAPKPKAKPKTVVAAKPAVTPSIVAMQSAGTFETAAPTSAMKLTMSPEEFEPASFTAKSAKPLTDVTFKVSDLANGKYKLAASNIKISGVQGDQLTPLAPFSIQPGEVVQFWTTVYVPNRTAPGNYKGELTAVAAGKAVGKFPVEVTVLAMRLLNSSKQYGYSLSATDDVQAIAKLRTYGVGLTSVCGEPEKVGGGIAAIRSAGLGTTVPYFYPNLTIDQIAQASEAARAAGITRFYYAVDSGSGDPAQVQAAADLLTAMKAKRMKTFAIINTADQYDKLASIAEYVNVSIDLPYVQSLLAGEKRPNLRHDWIFWDMGVQPMQNRLNAGWILWKTGLDGAFIPSKTGVDASSEPLFTTVQGEAFREGVDDTRYVTSMMSILREVKDALKVGGTKNAVAAEQAVTDSETYLNAVLAKPLATLTNKDVQAIRLKLAQYTIKLTSLKK